MNKTKINPVKWMFYILITSIIVLGLFFYRTVFSYIFASLIFAYLLNPLVVYLERRKINRTVAVASVYLLLVMVLVSILLIVIPAVYRQIQSVVSIVAGIVQSDSMSELEAKIPFYANIKAQIINLDAKYPSLNIDNIMKNFMEKLHVWLSSIPSSAMNYLGQLLTIFSFIATIPIIGFFILKDQNNFKKSAFKVVPNRYFELSLILMEKIDSVVGKYLRAVLIEIICVAILTSIALTILGVKYALVIGIIAGFANAIPYFGPAIGWLLSVISVLVTGKPMISVGYVTLAMYIVQVVDNNVIYPVVIGNSTEMHPLTILLTVIAGGYAFGIMGMFLSVPLVYLIKETVIVLYKNLKAFQII